MRTSHSAFGQLLLLQGVTLIARMVHHHLEPHHSFVFSITIKVVNEKKKSLQGNNNLKIDALVRAYCAMRQHKPTEMSVFATELKLSQ
jgi:hypothetical protein